jgi:hypothetical protein
MLKVRITILQDDEELTTINKTLSSSESFSTFTEIESGCDLVFGEAIPEIEQFLLAKTQEEYSIASNKKKRNTTSRNIK